MNQQLKAPLMVGILLTFLALSCSKGNNYYGSTSSNTPVTPPAAVNNIRLSTTSKFGKILTDSAGNTLYFYSIDANGQSGCTGGCLAAWPVFFRANPTLDSGLAPSDFGAITRTDGSRQTTYKGWPLYYYTGDIPGAINGDAVENVWFVAKPDYSVMLAEGPLKGDDGNFYDSTFKVSTSAATYEYLTDAYGRTLYEFSHDKNGINTFTSATDTAQNAIWPIYQLNPVQNVPSILSTNLFSTINVFGQTQLTFKGWPLYYFGADEQTRGNTLGVSVPTPGTWPVVNQFSTAAPQ